MKLKLPYIFIFCTVLSCCCRQTCAPENPSIDCCVTVNVAQDLSTKVIFEDDAAARASEGSLSSLEVFIFSADGSTLEGHARSQGAASLDVTCKSGEKAVAALVNAPDMSDCTTLENLRKKEVRLEAMSADKIVMYGEKGAYIEGSTTVSVDVSKILSRVVIRSVENRFSLASLQAKEFRITGIYLLNVQGANSLSLNSYQDGAGVWYNKMKNENSAVKSLVSDTVGKTLSYGSTLEESHYFYAMPNDFASSAAVPDLHGGSWAKRYTRLVVEATLDSEKMYYPISLTSLKGNTSYEIEKLVITKKGSSDPDTPVDSEDVSFDVTVKPWDVVLLGQDGVVTI